MIPFVPKDDSSDLQISADSELLRWRRRGVGQDDASDLHISADSELIKWRRRGVGQPSAVAKTPDESQSEASEWLYSVDSNIKRWRNQNPGAPANESMNSLKQSKQRNNDSRSSTNLSKLVEDLDLKLDSPKQAKVDLRDGLAATPGLSLHNYRLVKASSPKGGLLKSLAQKRGAVEGIESRQEAAPVNFRQKKDIVKTVGRDK